MIVLKFGGTSVGSAERMKSLLNLINFDGKRLVVLSAMSGTTNALVEIAAFYYKGDVEEASAKVATLKEKYDDVVKQLLQTDEKREEAQQWLNTCFANLNYEIASKFSDKEEKVILAQGELLSTGLFQLFLEEIGVKSALLPALEFMKIDEDEEPDMSFIERELANQLNKFPDVDLFITQGYICRNAACEVDNLKRGGSDYTASLTGAAADAAEIQIWTDIDGMHNNDPRIVKNTYPIRNLSFDEAAELSYFGAKILHPSTIRPAKVKGIPVRLLNTMEPEKEGTIISGYSGGEAIKAVAAKDGITAIKIKSGRMLLAYGFLKKVFEVFDNYKTPIDMITTSEVAVSLTIDNVKNLDAIVDELQQYGQVQVDHDQTIICVVGDFIGERPGLAMEIFDALKNIPIRMISYGGSRNNISLLVSTEYKNQSLNALHEGLFVKQMEKVV